MGNLFIDTAGILAREGLHQATIVETKHVGKEKTVYGMKDFQLFKFEVFQVNDDGEREIATLYQRYHRSFDPLASMTKLLAALGIKTVRGKPFDFGDLVGKKLNIIVTHAKDAKGVIHANLRPAPRPTGTAK